MFSRAPRRESRGRPSVMNKLRTLLVTLVASVAAVPVVAQQPAAAGGPSARFAACGRSPARWRRSARLSAARRRPVGLPDGAREDSRDRRDERARPPVGHGVRAERRHVGDRAPGPTARRAQGRCARSDADRRAAENPRRGDRRVARRRAAPAVRAQSARLLLVLEARRAERGARDDRGRARAYGTAGRR